MNTDLSRAVQVCVDYLTRRDAVRSKLEVYVNTGVRAQSLEQDRSVGFTTARDPDDPDEGPRVSDPTGASGSKDDGFRSLLDELDQAEARIVGALNFLARRPLFTVPAQCVRPLGCYAGGSKELDGAVRSSAKVFRRALAHTVDGNTRDETGRSADGDDGCESCARLKLAGVPWWNPVSYNGGRPTDLGGSLPRKVLLCRTCQRFAIEQEPTRLPTVDELRHRHDDPRGQWPKRYAVVR